MKKFLKKFLLIRRIKDGLVASRYFNKKYFQILRWMIYSKEDANFTYDLTKQNLNELYKLLEHIFDVDFTIIKGYSEELLKNDTLKKYLKSKIESSNFKNFADNDIKYSRRIGWYIIARIIKPQTIISKLSKNSVILGDNSHSTDELLKFSIEHGRNFVLFRERPKNHWYPGAGIGISFIKK